MLYPNFSDLVALKNQKLKLFNSSHRSVRSAVPGNHISPFRGQGMEFDSVREYVPGDDIRNIDWRVTARTGAPHLKLFKQERERQMFICVDMNDTMRFGTKNTFKSIQAAYAAAFLGWRGLDQHDSVSVLLFGDVPSGIHFFPPKRAGKSFCSVLKMLSDPPIDSHYVSIDSALQLLVKSSQSGSLIYFISDFMELSKDVEVSISRISNRSDVVFIAINDPMDSTLYPAGTIGFCSKAEKTYINTDSAAERDAYKAHWMENRECLFQITSKFKIPLIELTTESNICRDLVFGLKGIKKGMVQKLAISGNNLMPSFQDSI